MSDNKKRINLFLLILSIIFAIGIVTVIFINLDFLYRFWSWSFGLLVISGITVAFFTKLMDNNSVSDKDIAKPFIGLGAALAGCIFFLTTTVGGCFKMNIYEDDKHFVLFNGYNKVIEVQVNEQSFTILPRSFKETKTWRKENTIVFPDTTISQPFDEGLFVFSFGNKDKAVVEEIIYGSIFSNKNDPKYPDPKTVSNDVYHIRGINFKTYFKGEKIPNTFSSSKGMNYRHFKFSSEYDFKAPIRDYYDKVIRE